MFVLNRFIWIITGILIQRLLKDILHQHFPCVVTILQINVQGTKDESSVDMHTWI